MSTPNRPGSGPVSPSEQTDRADRPRQSTRPQPARPTNEPARPANEPARPTNESGNKSATGAPQPPQGGRPPVRPPQAPNSGSAPTDKPRADAPRPNAPQQSGPQQSGPQQSGPPPWQRGGQRDPQQGGPQQGGPQQGPKAPTPQQQPQTNLPTRGGELPHGGPGDSNGPQRPGQPGKPGAENSEAKTQRRDAVKSKAAGIDGPTRNIERKDLAKDMPDLSEVRHSEPATETQRAAHPVAIAAGEEGEALRATVQLRKIDPWSTLKISLVIAVSLFFVWMVAVGLLYAVLDGMGVWDRLNSAFTDIVSESSEGGLVSAGQVFGYAAVIGLINVVLFTALTTIGSFIYNLSSDLVGGVELTLADRD